MGYNSKIEWTESTWNPVTGCSKISPGCKNCYAERMALRLRAMGQKNYMNGFKLTLHPHLVEAPLHWKKSQTIFVNSMSDLFHEEIPDDFIFDIFRTMNLASHHIFQVLTKRSKRLLEISSKLSWGSNIWMGVSVENQDLMHRIINIQQTDARVKFVSFEPLLGPIDSFPTDSLDWIIVGGESGPKARPIRPEWVRSIRDICLKKGVPFFFKQWGGKNKKANGCILDGEKWQEMPALP